MIAPRLRIRLPSAPKDGTPSQRQWFAAVTNWINAVVDDAATPVTATQDKVTRRSLQIDMVDNTPDLEKPLSQAAQARFTAIQESLSRLTASTSVTVIRDWDVAATGATPTTAKSGMYFRATTAGTVGALSLSAGDVVLFYLDNTGALQWIIVDSPAERSAAYTPADWAATTGVARIENKPTLFGLSSLLTGLGAGSNTVIAAADTLLQALEKLQAQASANAANISTNAELLAPVPRKLGSSWYVSGRWYDPCHPFFLATTTTTVAAGAVQFVPFCPVNTLTAQQIGIYVSTAAAAGSKIRLGIYADSAGTPGARLYDSGDIASDSAGNKTAACTQEFTAGVRCWLALYSGASVGVYALVGTAMGQVNLFGSSTAYAMSGQSGLPTSATGAVFSGIHNPRIMLQAG